MDKKCPYVLSFNVKMKKKKLAYNSFVWLGKCSMEKIQQVVEWGQVGSSGYPADSEEEN